MSDKTEDKVMFKCKHCENDDMKHFVFYSLETQSDTYKNHPYRQNWDRETTPKIPIGFHIRCAKCNKDTFYVVDSYQPTLWGNDIPQQCLVNVKFEKPAFSAINYILTDDGFLDQIVLTANNDKISLITKKQIDDSMKFSVIGKSQYELLLSRGLKESGYIEPIKEVIPSVVEEKIVNTVNNNNNSKGTNNKNN